MKKVISSLVSLVIIINSFSCHFYTAWNRATKIASYFRTEREQSVGEIGKHVQDRTPCSPVKFNIIYATMVIVLVVFILICFCMLLFFPPIGICIKFNLGTLGNASNGDCLLEVLEPHFQPFLLSNEPTPDCNSNST